MFQHDLLDTCCFECLIGTCVLYFCICTCSAQLSMFHMERCARNTLIISSSSSSIVTGNAEGGEDTWQLYSGKDFIKSGVPSTPAVFNF